MKQGMFKNMMENLVVQQEVHEHEEEQDDVNYDDEDYEDARAASFTAFAEEVEERKGEEQVRLDDEEMMHGRVPRRRRRTRTRRTANVS